MSNLKWLFVVCILVILSMPARANSSSIECELSRFNYCLSEYSAGYCAKQAIEECSTGEDDILLVTPLRRDCKILADQRFFLTDIGAKKWRDYSCCERMEAENCYIEGTVGGSVVNGGSETLESCALKAADTCQKEDPRSKPLFNLITSKLVTNIFLFLALGLFLWLVVIVAISARRHKDQIIADILKEATALTGTPAVREYIRYSCAAMYYGGCPKYPGSFKVEAYAIGSSLYFQRVGVKGVRFRIDLADIADFGVFSPSLPYVMNLNAAGVLANEMTRRQFGSSAFIEYRDSSGSTQTIRIGEFSGLSAEGFVDHLGSHLEEFSSH